MAAPRPKPKNTKQGRRGTTGYVKLAAPEREVLRIVREESKRNGPEFAPDDRVIRLARA